MHGFMKVLLENGEPEKCRKLKDIIEFLFNKKLPDVYG